MKKNKTDKDGRKFPHFSVEVLPPEQRDKIEPPHLPLNMLYEKALEERARPNGKKAEEVHRLYAQFADKYRELNPNWIEIKLFELLAGAADYLQKHIEDPGIKGITWERPYAELQYPTEIKPEELPDPLSEFIPPDVWLRKETSLVLFRTMFEPDVYEVKKNGRYALHLSVDRAKALDALPEEKRKEELEKLYKPKADPPLQYTFKGTATNKNGKQKRWTAILLFTFRPLVLDQDAGAAYYPVYIGLEFTGFRPTNWSEEDQKDFWKYLHKEIAKDSPKVNLLPQAGGDLFAEELAQEEEKIQPPEPIVLPAEHKPERRYKASLYAELQKFHPKPANETQLALFQKVSDTVSSLGLDLSLSENKALTAIQKLLTETNYEGNLAAETIRADDTGFKYEGNLPQLEFTPAQYYEAFGVGNRLTQEGWKKYNSNECKAALKALMSLAQRQFAFAYERKYWDQKGERKTDAIYEMSPAIKIMWGVLGMSDEEAEKFKAGGFTKDELANRATIKIRPAPPLVDGIKNYFVLIPNSLFDDVKQLAGGKHSQYITLFIQYLIATAEIQRREKSGWKIKIGFKRLAEKLRMNVSARQWGRIRTILQDCYETASKLGYLKEYKTTRGRTGQEVEEFTLNPAKFTHGKTA